MLLAIITWLAVVYSDSYNCKRKHMFWHEAQSAGPGSCIAFAFIKGLLIKLRSWLFANASGASVPFHNRDRARFGCILGEIGAFGPPRPSCPYLTENASKACTIP